MTTDETNHELGEESSKQESFAGIAEAVAGGEPTPDEGEGEDEVVSIEELQRDAESVDELADEESDNALSEEFDTDYSEYFPFDQPYDAQRLLMAENHTQFASGGFSVTESACGTGKTLSALVPAIQQVRDPSTKYKRVVAVTNVKQQLRAFEDDLQSINQNLPDGIRPIKGLTLTGKADMCAYTAAGEVDTDDIYGKCEDVRAPVRNIGSKSNNLEEARQNFASLSEAAKVSSQSSSDAVTARGGEWISPMRTGFPTSDFGSGDPDTDYCGFYAEYRKAAIESERKPVMDFRGVMTPPRLLKEAAEQGMCPHMVMQNLLPHAEVVMGNYKHLFNPLTIKAMTRAIISEETIVVIDEAHNLVPNVRDELSEELTLNSIESAIREITYDVQDASSNVARHIQSALSAEGFTEEDVEEFLHLLIQVRDWLYEQTEDMFEAEIGDKSYYDISDLDEELQKSLRPPKSPQPDQLSLWMSDEGHLEALGKAESIGEAIRTGMDNAVDEISGYTVNETFYDTAGRVLGHWHSRDHTQYFREIRLKRRSNRYEKHDEEWGEYYLPRLVLNNCIPSDEIANRLDDFGAGVLMSATLAPLDAYRRTSGVVQLTERGRNVEEFIHGLPFPEENRESLAVDLPKFTYKNRGGYNSRYWNADQKSVRKAYSDAIIETCRSTEGNVLIVMPSYSLGEWAADEIRNARIGKDVLVDQSSTDAETERLKERFFDGEGKVLVTGALGTLTEGVDYNGEKLKAAGVFGVPLENTNGPLPDAIQTAYEAKFGSNGFNYAFTVPAVRKTRQALGRVIRGAEETGVRVVGDRRYCDSQWDAVRKYFPDYEQTDYDVIDPHQLESRIDGFWSSVQ